MQADIVYVESVGRGWDWFCSFTVATRNVHPVRLSRAFEGWTRRVCARQNIPPRLVLSAWRSEHGLDVAHIHGHALIGGLRHTGTSERFRAIRDWEIVSRSCFGNDIRSGWHVTEKSLFGTCRIRLYDPGAGAAGYLAKHLNASECWGWLNSEIVLSPRAYQFAYRNRNECAVDESSVGRSVAV